MDAPKRRVRPSGRRSCEHSGCPPRKMSPVPDLPRIPCASRRAGASRVARTVAESRKEWGWPSRYSPKAKARKARRCRAAQKYISFCGSLIMTKTVAQRLEQFLGRFRDHRPRWENCLCTGLLQRIVVLRRHHAADHDHDIAAALLCEFGFELRHQREMGGGERRHAQ